MPNPRNPIQDKDRFVRRVTDYAMPRDDDRLAEVHNLRRPIYSGKSARIRRMIDIAYARGVRRGAGMAWEAQQPISLRRIDATDAANVDTHAPDNAV